MRKRFEKQFQCTVGQEKQKKNPINFNANYRREIKFISINMDYCLLQFDAMNFFLEVRLHGGALSNFNFFNINPPNCTTKSKSSKLKLPGYKFLKHF